MKTLLIISILILSKLVYSQTYLVPYKVGNKMGLSNEKGKLIVKPEYDDIEYLETQTMGNYFKYTNVSVQIDTIIRYDNKKEAQEKKVYSYGLFKEDNLLIKNQNCSDFIIYPNLIIASTNPYNALRCVVYNLKGKQLTNEFITNMYVNERRNFGNLSSISNKHTLLSIMQRDEKNNALLSLAIYDNEKQDIAQWLLKKVTSFKLNDRQRKKNFTGVSYIDKEGFHEKFIRFKNNNFEIVNQNELSPQEQDELAKNEEKLYGSGTGNGNIDVKINRDSYDDVAVPDYLDIEKEEKKRVPYPETEAEKYRQTFYLNKKGTDSLFFVEPNTRELFETQPSKQTLIKVPKDVEIIYLSSGSFTQFLQLIYKKNNKYGVLNRGVFSKTLYDTLLYFGGDYIAGIKNKNKYQYGIITASETEILAIAYDSIYGDVKQAEFVELNRKYNEPYKTKYMISNRKKEYGSQDPKFNFAVTKKALVTFYKNGKMGILDAVSNKVVFPAEYDFIAENNIHYSEPKVYKFYVFKKNNKYGVTHLDYNSALKKYETRMLIQPVFSYIPCYYRNHYYKIKDVKLFELFDEDGKSAGYASENGFEYFENIKDK